MVTSSENPLEMQTAAAAPFCIRAAGQGPALRLLPVLSGFDAPARVCVCTHSHILAPTNTRVLGRPLVSKGLNPGSYFFFFLMCRFFFCLLMGWVFFAFFKLFVLLLKYS